MSDPETPLPELSEADKAAVRKIANASYGDGAVFDLPSGRTVDGADLRRLAGHLRRKDAADDYRCHRCDHTIEQWCVFWDLPNPQRASEVGSFAFFDDEADAREAVARGPGRRLARRRASPWVEVVDDVRLADD